MNKLKKLLLTIIIFIIGVMTCTIVNAAPVSEFEVFDGEEGVVSGHFKPHLINGNMTWCINFGGSFNATLTREQFNAYTVGGFTDKECEKDAKAPWNGKLRYMKYTLKEQLLAWQHQDEAYILADAIEKGQDLSSWDTAYATWSSSVSNPRQSFAQAAEAIAFKNFYEQTHNNDIDIFATKIIDRTNKNEVNIGVDQETGTYTVGPFLVDYPDGQYDGKNKFCWITDIKAITDAGTYNVEVVSPGGAPITGLGRDEQSSLSGREFCIRFKSKDATNVSLKIDFGYLESCDAEMWKYEGQYFYRYWERYDAGQCQHFTSNHNVYYDSAVRYKLEEEPGDDTQVVMALVGTATKNYGNASIILVPEGIDLTMKIEGDVFLDKETGKANTGNNRFDKNLGEALPGVEVTLCDENGNKVTIPYTVKHKHVGSSVQGTGCYTVPVYHVHDGTTSSYGRCYTNPSHTHIGSSTNGGPGTCFQTPVYHTHEGTCYDANNNIVCGINASVPLYYANTCGQQITYSRTCGKNEQTIDYYKVGCGKTEDTVERTEVQGNTKLTDENGHYIFEHLNAMKKYYIQFTYNGMLFTNVKRLEGNADDISKSTEAGQGHNSNRQDFNNVFAEIGSYPQNYKTKDCITGQEIYNRTFLQEDIADLFKEVASAVVEHNGDEKKAYQTVIDRHQNDPDIRKKVQYIADNRIHAYTTEKYPLINIFTIDNEWNNIAGVNFDPIYEGRYSQLHVNLGIKARQTFDLALYKDVLNAVLEINGKSETYLYDARQDWQNQGFSLGVNEDFYIAQLREKYIKQNANIEDLKVKELIDEGEYKHELRPEEIINGNNLNITPNGSSQMFENENQHKENYVWRDINHKLSEQDKLKIHITYKLAIRNQSEVVGAVTELVDYYDNNYQFEKAYVGDENGNELPGTKVDVSETSKYGTATHIATNGKYKTIYLRPTEQKLHTNSQQQYVYVTFGLINPEQTLNNAKLQDGQKLYTYNLAEINGYKTYGVTVDENSSMGLVDKDSNPGNFAVADYVKGQTKLEDDESGAPAYVYSIRGSRTLEGNVFEDAITSLQNPNTVSTDKTRFGNGTIDSTDKKIKDVKVELVEIKPDGADKKLIVRATAFSDEDGWYGFGAFLPGDYVIRFTYGLTDGTAMTIDSEYRKGKNDTSYNGQDYQSTTFTTKQGEIATTQIYKEDEILQGIYQNNNNVKNADETNLQLQRQYITKYQNDNYYWYADYELSGKSDAYDDVARRQQIKNYAKTEYGKEITNHKVEVFNSYINQENLRKEEQENTNADWYKSHAQPIDKEVNTKEYNSKLVDELERRTYQYAYTPEILVEVEYTKKESIGNQPSENYTYKITGVDFGIVQRPKSELTIDQDVEHIKVTATDGTILFDTSNGTNNLQWVAKGDINKYDKKELINVILDNELLNGSKLEITYNLTLKNNGEKEIDTNGNIVTTRAKTILNYVANNLNFDVEDNKDSNGKALWETVKLEDVQNNTNSTLVNNAQRNNKLKVIDLSTQAVILKATNTNPLSQTHLKPGESVTTTLHLKKVLATESQSDDLTYTNLAEIVELDNTVGRYDKGSVPGNQSLEVNPREHDTAGVSKYVDDYSDKYPDDGRVIVTPPTGSKQTYYGIGIVITVILAVGIFLIKKFVINKNNENNKI